MGQCKADNESGKQERAHDGHDRLSKWCEESDVNHVMTTSLTQIGTRIDSWKMVSWSSHVLNLVSRHHGCNVLSPDSKKVDLGLISRGFHRWDQCMRKIHRHTNTHEHIDIYPHVSMGMFQAQFNVFNPCKWGSYEWPFFISASGTDSDEGRSRVGLKLELALHGPSGFMRMLSQFPETYHTLHNYCMHQYLVQT